MNVARLPIGTPWKGKQASIMFNPPIKLDGDVATDLIEEAQKFDNSKLHSFLD